MKNLFFFIASIACLTLVSSCMDSDAYAKTEENYGEEVEKYAKIYQLPSPYLKALIVLESSGKKPPSTRFEKKIYRELIEVRDGKRVTCQGLRRKDIRGLSNGAIKNLSTSWGPFQLMGYQALKLNVHVKDIRGPESVKWGIKWINDAYGDYLRKGKFEEAFRIHNTGRPHGRTYDSDYVKNGLKHIEHFQSNNP